MAIKKRTLGEPVARVRCTRSRGETIEENGKGKGEREVIREREREIVDEKGGEGGGRRNE